MVITVFSPSGGVGKTTIALAMSRVLSAQGLTCLLELDFTPGDIAVSTDIELKPLTDAINTNPLLAVQRPDKANFDVLTAGYPDTGETINYDEVVRLIDELKTQYQFVVIDTQSHLIANVVAALLAADIIIFPLVDEITAVAKLIGMVEYLENNKYADMSKAVIVANKVNRKNKYISVAKFSVATICHIPLLNNFHNNDVRLTKAMSPLLDKWVTKPIKGGMRS